MSSQIVLDVVNRSDLSDRWAQLSSKSYPFMIRPLMRESKNDGYTAIRFVDWGYGPALGPMAIALSGGLALCLMLFGPTSLFSGGKPDPAAIVSVAIVFVLFILWSVALLGKKRVLTIRADKNQVVLELKHHWSTIEQVECGLGDVHVAECEGLLSLVSSGIGAKRRKCVCLVHKGDPVMLLACVPVDKDISEYISLLDDAGLAIVRDAGFILRGRVIR